MKQDLFDWLNSTHTDNTSENEGTSENVIPPLLLVPVSGELPDFEPEEPHPENSAPTETNTPQSEIYAPSESQEPHITTSGQARITAFNEAWQGTFTEELQASPEDEDIEPENTTDVQENTPQPENIPDIQDDTPQPENIPPEESYADSQEYDSFPDEEHTSVLNQAWHNAAGLSINFTEPPQEMWTDIDSDDDDEPKDYEENMSLQGDAYIPVPKHGANFTQRLQATLQGRKDRAAKKRELDAENASQHPYFQKAVIFCGVLLMALGFGYFGLWFIQRETPDGINQRAARLYEQGKFDEAENLYHRGYNRYPHVLGFLTGMARSAEKAGRTQTAIAAWTEYVSSLPKNDTEHRRAAQEELDRLIPGHPRKNSQPAPKTAQTLIPAKPAPQKSALPKLPEVRAMTFHEVLAEGNNAYNIGMFSRAIANFHKAHAIRENDIRPYIGLAASYRAKGLFFDAKRMLDEARRKFWHHPTLEVERYFLRRE